MITLDQNPLNIVFMQIMKDSNIECYYSDIPSDYRVSFTDINKMIRTIIAESFDKRLTHKLNFGGIDVRTEWNDDKKMFEIVFSIDCFWIPK